MRILSEVSKHQGTGMQRIHQQILQGSWHGQLQTQGIQEGTWYGPKWWYDAWWAHYRQSLLSFQSSVKIFTKDVTKLKEYIVNKKSTAIHWNLFLALWGHCWPSLSDPWFPNRPKQHNEPRKLRQKDNALWTLCIFRPLEKSHQKKQLFSSFILWHQRKRVVVSMKSGKFITGDVSLIIRRSTLSLLSKVAKLPISSMRLWFLCAFVSMLDK